MGIDPRLAAIVKASRESRPKEVKTSYGCFICHDPNLELEIDRYGKWYKLCKSCGERAPDSYPIPKRRTVGEIFAGMKKLR